MYHACVLTAFGKADCQYVKAAFEAGHQNPHHPFTSKANMSIRDKLAPPPAILRQLAPFLRHIDLSKILRGPVAHDSQAVLPYWSVFASKHVNAISGSKALLSLCISDLPGASVSVRDSLVTCIPLISTLTSLTKLHISTAGGSVIHFQPLSQLTQLRDLGLQCMTASASCAHVLRSSRQTLQRVKLIALS